MRAAIRWLSVSVLILFYGGLETLVVKGSSGMHSLSGRLVLTALVLFAAGVSIIVAVVATQRKVYSGHV